MQEHRNIEEKFRDFLQRWPLIHELYCKYEEVLVYLVIGFINTVVSWTAKFAWNFCFFSNTLFPTKFQNAILSTVGWVAGVLFAYPTNRVYVFKSNGPIFKEACKFISSRLATWGLDIVTMLFLCNICNINIIVSTVVASVLVVITNYLLSKLAVFVNEE